MVTLERQARVQPSAVIAATWGSGLVIQESSGMSS